MSIEGEAAGDVLTGALIAATVDGKSDAAAAPSTASTCLNCGAALTGRYCIDCGQAAHIHRTLTSLGHDILHGVFHFEGRVWRTLPELYFHPGRLTRRYIDGQRVRFVSPMALFLFTVFLTFAVFPLVSGAWLSDASQAQESVLGKFTIGNQSAIATTEAELATLKQERQQPDLTLERRTVLDRSIAEKQDALRVMNALAQGNWQDIAAFDKEQREKKTAATNSVDTRWPALDSRLGQSLQQLNDNPVLLLYKLKTNGYKYSWALIPLSLPFMWLLFFWRRDVHLYDHAIFVTYSICFMMQFVLVMALIASLGTAAVVWGTALALLPPLHVYKQLRGTYGLSRFGAFARLVLLGISALLASLLFTFLLLLLGLLA